MGKGIQFVVDDIMKIEQDRQTETIVLQIEIEIS